MSFWNCNRERCLSPLKNSLPCLLESNIPKYRLVPLVPHCWWHKGWRGSEGSLGGGREETPEWAWQELVSFPLSLRALLCHWEYFYAWFLMQAAKYSFWQVQSHFQRVFVSLSFFSSLLSSHKFLLSVKPGSTNYWCLIFP